MACTGEEVTLGETEAPWVCPKAVRRHTLPRATPIEQASGKDTFQLRHHQRIWMIPQSVQLFMKLSDLSVVFT
jgi:hypothetical protein